MPTLTIEQFAEKHDLSVEAAWGAAACTADDHDPERVVTVDDLGNEEWIGTTLGAEHQSAALHWARA